MSKSPIPFQKIRNSYLDDKGIPNFLYIYKFYLTRFRRPVGIIFENNGDLIEIKVSYLNNRNEILPGPINFFIEDYKIFFEMLDFCVNDYFSTFNSIKKIKINFI